MPLGVNDTAMHTGGVFMLVRGNEETVKLDEVCTAVVAMMKTGFVNVSVTRSWLALLIKLLIIYTDVAKNIFKVFF